MKVYARFDEILNVGYFLNGVSILDEKLCKFSGTTFMDVMADDPLF